MTIKTPWSSEVHMLDKDCWQTSIQQWFRSKKMGDKPYIPEGFIEIDGERYIANVIKPHTQGNPTDSSHNSAYIIGNEKNETKYKRSIP